MTKPQVILDDAGKPAFAVIPWREYARLAMMDAATGLTDEQLYDHANSVGEESFPIEVADRLLAGENAVRVFRDHRGMTQKQLAGAAGINPLYLSQIERGVRTGSARTLSALAEALGVDVDDLI
ncbi:MAG: helix-turn-helix transcriptional regulator [Candidatus Aminicenantes bacterium]|nr:helix-turn-helix transcriptional regulator [Candidatus Aminicenantes bacterium]